MKLWKSLAGPVDAERLLRQARVDHFGSQTVLMVGRPITSAESAAIKQLWESKYAGMSIEEVLAAVQRVSS